MSIFTVYFMLSSRSTHLSQDRNSSSPCYCDGVSVSSPSLPLASPLSSINQQLLSGHPSTVHQNPSVNTKPTYTFIVGFGVPKVPTPDFDPKAMAHRLTVFARSLDFVMGANNVSAELVIIQWAPTVNDSLIGLIHWEQLELQSLAMVRIIGVPEEMTKLTPPCVSSLNPYELAQEGPVCLEFVTKNVGARRSLGQFLVLLNIDDILTPQLGSLFSTPSFWQSNVYWRASRLNLPEKVPLDLQSGEELYNRALGMLNWTSNRHDPDSIKGPIVARSLGEINGRSDLYSGDFLLMRSEDFVRMGGYPELGKSNLSSVWACLNCVCLCL